MNTGVNALSVASAYLTGAPREKGPSDVWDEGGLDGMRVHVDFEGMQVGVEGMSLGRR